MGKTILERGWFRLLAVLLVMATFVLIASRRPKLPGSVGAMAARLRVGMPHDEAVAVVQARSSNRDRAYWSLHGETRDGRKFSGVSEGLLDDLPPAHEIAWAEITVNDDDDRDLIITLGPGGVV